MSLQVIELIIVAIPAICAVITSFYAYKMIKISRHNNEISFDALKENRDERKLNLHYQFQSTIRDLQKLLPATVNEKDYIPTIEEKRIITLYWYGIFDEWFICKKHSKYYEDLWDNIYCKGISSAFKIPAFKIRIEEMFEKGESSFMGYGMEFKKVLNEICYSSTNTQLR